MKPTADQRLAYEQAAATQDETRQCLMAAFGRIGLPRMMLDIGCGPGHLVHLADALKIQAVGLDICLTDEVTHLRNGSVLQRCDLSEPWRSTNRFDLVLCLEVAEHLPRKAADTLCDTVAEAASGVVLFSAATPGQGGAGHLNEQTHEYWRMRLSSRGLRQDRELERDLRRAWSIAAPHAWWYGLNLLVYGVR